MLCLDVSAVFLILVLPIGHLEVASVTSPDY